MRSVMISIHQKNIGW